MATTPTLTSRLGNPTDHLTALQKAIMSNLRVAMPGVIASFDSVKQTASVDVTIYDRVMPGLPGGISTYSPVTGDVKIPTLLDVPVVIPQGGGFALTIPIKIGDECLVVFSDMCINEWFDAGGINNVQQVLRRHDLSDAICIPGPSSQPNVIMAYQTSALEMRTKAGDVKVSVQVDKVSITAPEIDLDGPVNFTGVVSAATGPATFYLPIEIGGVPYRMLLQPA